MHSTSSRAARLARAAAVVLLVAGCSDSNGPAKIGPPTDIVVSAGDNQKGGAGLALAAPIAAKVTDANGRGVPNVQVDFVIADGGGSLAPLSAQTNGSGVATTSLTMPTTAGITTVVRAAAIDPTTGALIDTVSFHEKTVGAAPTYLAVGSATDPRAATGGTAHLQVIAYDRYANRSPGATITWSVVSGGGSLTTATSVTDSIGLATGTVKLGAAGGYNTFRATSGNATADFTVLGVVPGKPDAVIPGPYPGAIGFGATTPLSVTVRDGLGNPVKDSTVRWSVVAGTGTLSASSSVTDAQGKATVNFTAGSAAESNTVRAAIGGLAANLGFVTRNVLTGVSSSAFGIGRSPTGVFAVSLINAGQVVVFDQATPNTQRTVDVGGTPVVVAIDAAGNKAWVSNMSGWVDVVSLAAGGANARVDNIPGAHSITASPSGNRMYVTSTAGKVYVVSTATRLVTDSVVVPYGPWGIAFRTSGSDTLMYVTSRDGGTVTEINTTTMAVLRTITVGGRPHGIVISPDQSTLYVADDQGTVKAVSIGTGNVTSSVTLSGAFGIAISPDGSTLFVVTNDAHGVVITASTLAVTKSITLLGNGRQVISAPDGNSAWTATSGGSIDIINR